MTSRLPRVDLCMVFDDRHAVHAATALTSAAHRFSGEGRLTAHLIAANLSAASVRGLRRFDRAFPQVEVRLHPADLTAFQGWRRAPHISHAAYLRLQMGDVLPRDVRRVVYLDTDVLCLDSIDALHSAELGDAAIGAVRDTSTPVVSSERGIARFAEFGMRPMDPYFNSGVLVIDVDRWRQADPMTFGRDYVDRHGDVQRALDQELLNVCFHGAWRDVGLRWNLSPRLVRHREWSDPVARTAFGSEVEIALRDPAIVHFVGPNKPWRFGSAGPFHDQYRRAMMQSPYLATRAARLRRVGRQGGEQIGEQLLRLRRRARALRGGSTQP